MAHKKRGRTTPRQAKYTKEEQIATLRTALSSRCEEVIDPDHINKTIAKAYAALLAIDSGQADTRHLEVLVEAANASVVLCEVGIGGEFAAACAEASVALVSCIHVFRTTGDIRLSPEQVAAVAEMIEVREAQLRADGYTEGIEFRAAETVEKRLKDGHVVTVEDIAEVSA
jgi:hypothetical protein